jgi:hypothetical protein
MDGKKLIIKIGLDIDGTTDQTLTRRRINRYLGLIERFVVYESASGKGLHFELYLKRPVTIGESFTIRENLGDDPKRLMFSKADHARGWDFDILFTLKKINGEWKRRKFVEEVILNGK